MRALANSRRVREYCSIHRRRTARAGGTEGERSGLGFWNRTIPREESRSHDCICVGTLPSDDMRRFFRVRADLDEQGKAILVGIGLRRVNLSMSLK